MKRIIAARRLQPLAIVAALLTLAMASGASARPTHHRRRDPFALAGAAFVTVLDGETLWSRNLEQHRAPASLTKLLTALVLLDSNWQPDAVLTVSYTAAHIEPVRVGLRTGERIRARDALTAMLMHSANDACMVLVEHAAPSLAAFAARMNSRAQQLGMHDSHFVHPCGYDEPGQYSTVSDLLLLARAAHADPRIASRVSQEKATISTLGGRRLVVRNTNHLLGHVPGVVGLKTGYTAHAGPCLIALADEHGHRVWLVLLDSRKRWWIAHRMIEAAFADAARETRSARSPADETHPRPVLAGS